MNKNLLLVLLLKKRQLRVTHSHKRKHRMWVRKIFLERKAKGEYHQLIQELRIYDHEFFLQTISYVSYKIRKTS